MPEEVLHQIQYLCKKIPKVEWSGALFYTTEGSIEKPETFKIILKTILPLDMGSSAYTEYNLDDRFIDFIEEDFEERCNWKLGHVHSHNVMGVFFSGTDMAELNDNAPSHNFYLSLIVNNYMEFLAKVAFIGEAKKDIKEVPYTAKNVNGEDYIIERQDFEVNTQKLFIYNCDILTPTFNLSVSEKFIKQVDKIMEPKPNKFQNNLVSTEWNKKETNKSRQFKEQEQRELDSWNKSFQDNSKRQLSLFEDWNSPYYIDEDDPNDLFDIETKAIYEFVKDLFNFTSYSLVKDSLEDVLEILKEFDLTPSELAQSVISSYSKSFSRHFPNASSNDFIRYTYEALDLLEEYKREYPEIGLTIKTITSMINKFVENETDKQHNSKR